jgi:transcriptional regulator with XRE-family HTH domain
MVDFSFKADHIMIWGRRDSMTPFGIANRKLRLDKGLRLLDLAKKLDLSSSYVSAVETGKKSIPPGYIALVVRALDLTDAEARELQKAADGSKKIIEVEGLKGSDRELVAAFARRLDDLSPEFLAEIKKQVFKSATGEIPFKRRRKGLLVAPASTKALWDFAEHVRSAFVDDKEVCFPIMDVLEFRMPLVVEDFHLDVCSHNEMGSEEGLVVAGSNCIKLREDVYEGAWHDGGRDRFTACHEFAHFLLHREIALPRIRDDSHPIYRDAEWQADTFAGGLLLSSRHLGQLGGPQNAAAKCGMTSAAATVMWSKYQKEGSLT